MRHTARLPFLAKHWTVRDVFSEQVEGTSSIVDVDEMSIIVLLLLLWKVYGGVNQVFQVRDGLLSIKQWRQLAYCHAAVNTFSDQ